MTPQLFKFLSIEHARLTLGLIWWSNFVVIATGVALLTTTNLVAAVILGAGLVVVAWIFLREWLRLRPSGVYGKFAYLLTAAINFIITGSFIWGVTTEESFAPTFVLWGIATVLLLVRILVGLASRAEQKRMGIYKKRHTAESYKTG